MKAVFLWLFVPDVAMSLMFQVQDEKLAANMDQVLTMNIILMKMSAQVVLNQKSVAIMQRGKNSKS